MKRIAWLTDIHLDFLHPAKVKAFCRSIAECNPDAVLIGCARTIKVYLRILEDKLCRTIYFVLGNHDYYRGSIAGRRTAIKEFCVRSDWLHWLPGLSNLYPWVVHPKWKVHLLPQSLPFLAKDFLGACPRIGISSQIETLKK